MNLWLADKWHVIGAGLLVILLAGALYAPSIGYDFTCLDDDKYVTENPLVLGGLTGPALRAAWTQSTESYWAPLLWMSYMLDVELFGPAPWSFHLTNVLLFALNVGVLFWLAWRWTGRVSLACATALLWALHPARVESVAWIAERKDVLSGLFFLLGLGAYVEGRRGTLRYGTALAWWCMLAGGLAKPVVAVMPAVLVLLDAWPLHRINWSQPERDAWSLAREKWAFWVVAIVLAVLPIWIHQENAAVLTAPLYHRLIMLPIHYFFYVQKVVWPSGLAVLLGDAPFHWSTFLAGLAVVLGGTWFLWQRRERASWALVGWLWFLGILFPLSGVVWVGAERLATRFLYLPQIGLTLAAVLWADSVLRARGLRAIWGAAFCVALLTVWGAWTSSLLPHWRDSRALFTRVLKINPNSVHAYDNLCKALVLDGRAAEWEALLERNHQARPGKTIADIHYAWWLAAMLGDTERSLAVARIMTGLAPTHPDFWTWLQGKTNDKKIIGLWCDTAGICLRCQGDVARMRAVYEAWEGQWDRRTQANYQFEELYACWNAGQEVEAAALARELGLGSGRPLAREDMPARFLSRWEQGARGYAFACFEDYLRWRPQDGLALNNLAWQVATTRPDGLRHARMEEWPRTALAWADRALEAGGRQNPGVWDTVAAARANSGDYTGAVAAAEQGLALATSANNLSLADGLRQRLAVYRAGNPWRE